MACTYICPGNATVYINKAAGAIAVNEPQLITGGAAGLWERIPQVLSWELEADVDEPDTFRTADTNMLRVSACPGSVEFSVTVTTKLCGETGDTWLYDYLFLAAHSSGWYLGGNTIQSAWFYLTWENSAPSATPSPTNDRGIFIKGGVTPPGMSLDNDEDTAAEAEFEITVATGPFFPVL